MKKLTIISILFLLSACGTTAQPTATPYQPLINNEGYADREIGKDEYEIQVRGNYITTHETLIMHFDRRASELCQGNNYDSSLEKKKITNITDARYHNHHYYFTYTPATLSTQAYVSGTVKCKMHRAKAGKK